MSGMKPRIACVHDGLGKMAIYMDECVGQNAIVSQFAPRYQQIVIRGEPCTVFFDKNTRYFIIAPITNKQEFMDRPGRYDHIIDLAEIPTAGTPGTTASGGALEQAEGDNEGNEGNEADNEGEEADALNSNEMDLNGPAPTTAGSPQSTEKIPRPPNSWILFRKEKSKELREANPSMSAGEVSTEAARQWKALSDEGKGFYQEMAKQAALQHKIQYPDYRYKPGRK